jgi:hypothetical protein
MAEGTQKPRYYGVARQKYNNGETGYRAYFYISPSWPAAVLQRCGHKGNVYLGSFKTEEAAASAVDQ